MLKRCFHALMLESSLKLETLNNLTEGIKGRSLDSDLKCVRRSDI